MNLTCQSCRYRVEVRHPARLGQIDHCCVYNPPQVLNVPGGVGAVYPPIQLQTPACRVWEARGDSCEHDFVEAADDRTGAVTRTCVKCGVSE